MKKTIKIVFYFKSLKQYAFAASLTPLFSGSVTCSYFGRYIIAHDFSTAKTFEDYLRSYESHPVLKNEFNLRGCRIVDQSY